MFRLTILIVFTLFLSMELWGQCMITGQITGDDGNPLIGANVVLIGTGKGAAADSTGLYRIKDVRPGEYTIRATFIGYQTVEKTAVVNSRVERMILHIQMSERIISVDELVVMSTRAGEKTPMTYSNLNKEDIEANNLGQDVPYLLRWTPSAVVTSDAGTGIGYTGIRIRGTDPTRINVTINGIPLNDAESQGVFWVDLPDFVSSTDDIQIQRGVGTSTNGAGAFGATINLNTTKLKKDPYVRLNGSLGSFNTKKGNVQFGTGLVNNKFTMEGRISRINSDGFIDRATADLESYYLSGAFLGKSSSLRFNAFSGHEVTYQAWNGVPTSILEEGNRTFNSAGTEKEGEPYDNEVDDYQQNHYQMLYNNQLNLNWNLNLALHYTKGMGFFEQYKADQSFGNYGLENVMTGNDTITETDLIRRLWLDNDFYGTTFGLNYLSNDNRLNATMGGAFNIYEGDHFGEVVWAEFVSNAEPDQRYYENDARKTDFNIYGKVNYELFYGLNAYLDLQVRQVTYDFLGFNRQGQNVEQTDNLTFFNPKFGLFYELDSRSNLYASFAVANREPNRNDYTESTIDSRPSPETLYNTEVGYRKNWGRSAISANIYHMLYSDQLALNGAINDVGEYTRINIDESYRVGVELVAGLRLTEGLNLQGNATFSRNKVKEFTEFIDTYDENFGFLGQEPVLRTDTDLAFSPDIIAGGELSWDVLSGSKNKDQNLQLSLLAKYVGQQYIDNTSDETNSLDPYFFSDFRVKYDLRNTLIKNIGLTLLVRNIFDAEFETNAWSYRYIFAGDTVVDNGFYPQAGRNFLLGLTLDF